MVTLQPDVGFADRIAIFRSMTYLDDVPRREIDLGLPAKERWKQVIAADCDIARRLLETGWHDALHDAHLATGKPMWLLKLAGTLAPGPFHGAYLFSGGRYLPEIHAWADAMGVRRSLLVMMQCMYELSHLDPVRPPLGCSAGARWIAGLGMVHVRTLDWNLPAIADATRIFEFRHGTRRHFTVGLPGLVGALSGMVPGGFSVTINWAPPAALPFFHSGPLFELRQTLEQCDTYGQAVARLSTVRLASSVFFTVCGIHRGEACVIERVKTGLFGGHEARIRHAGDGLVAQSNHYQHPDFARFNGAVEAQRSMLLRTSRERAALLADALEKTREAATLADLIACLGTLPVENEETRQKMVFCPVRGELHVLRAATA